MLLIITTNFFGGIEIVDSPQSSARALRVFFNDLLVAGQTCIDRSIKLQNFVVCSFATPSEAMHVFLSLKQHHIFNHP